MNTVDVGIINPIDGSHKYSVNGLNSTEQSLPQYFPIDGYDGHQIEWQDQKKGIQLKQKQKQKKVRGLKKETSKDTTPGDSLDMEPSIY